MSEQEKADIIGSTLLDYQEKKKTLCCLQTKAVRMATKLENAAAILKNVPDEHHGYLKHNLTSLDLPTEKAVLDVAHGIDALRSEIEHDRKSLKGMGVQFPIT